jgi:hypothetical protein
VIDKLTDFRLMALLPGMPEVITNRQLPRLTLSVIGDQFFGDAERCSFHRGYTRKCHKVGLWHQESVAGRALNRKIPLRKFKGDRWELVPRCHQ